MQEAAAAILQRRTARRSFTDYCEYIAPDEPPAEHHRLLCDVLQQVAERKILNLMVFMPPGSAKSTYASVRFPSWYLGRYPSKDIIQASNTADLAARFGRRVRNTIASQRYRQLFEVELAKDSQAKGQWEVIPAGEDGVAGGEYYATGVEGAVTGRRADGGLIDDPVRSKEDAESQRIRDKQWDWYLNDFCTRIKPQGWKIIIQTRWHQDDLSGRILPEDWSGETGWLKGRDGEVWYVLCLPCEAGEDDPLGREPGEVLWESYMGDTYRAAKRRLTNDDTGAVLREYYALYQQTPSADEGTFFQRDWLKRYVPGDQPDLLNRYGSGDFAVRESDSADYTVFGDWGVDSEGHWWLLDGYRRQSNPADWVSVLTDWFKTKPFFHFFGEGGVIRRAVEPFLTKEMRDQGAYAPVEWFNKSKDKAAMAQAFRGMCEKGLVHIPSTEFGDAVVRELTEFPVGKHDDCVDMCTHIGMAVDRGLAATIPEPQPAPEPSDYGLDTEDAEDWMLS